MTNLSEQFKAAVAFDNEDGFWVVVPVSEYTEHIEDLGPL